MTCRDEILAAISHLVSNTGHRTFSVADIVRHMHAENTRYEESTIRTHISSRMCANTPDHHARTYPDLRRIGPGLYELND